MAEVVGTEDVLIVSNHRTRVDWMFLWGLAAAMGRLSGLKIVLKDALRKAPGFGWATQCFGFAFMRRRNREADLATLRTVATFHGGRQSLALLLFPEGTDLSASNVLLDQAFAEKRGLTRYCQVLHPRTAGFVAAWTAMTGDAKTRGAPAPALLDVTIAYVEYTPGERPSETSIFLKGRACREVHIAVERVACGEGPEAEALCEKLFAEKEARLGQFYGPTGEAAGGSPSAPDVAALAEGATTLTLEASDAAFSRMACGAAAVLSLEALSAALAWHLGARRALLLAGASCAAFALITWKAGGVDQVLFRHAAQFPGEVCAGKED